MDPKSTKFIINLDTARKSLQTADHLTYVTFPLLKEQRLLLKVLEELQEAVVNIINAILQYEYSNRRIMIYNNARENFNTFKKIAMQYNISQEQLGKILEIMTLAEKHKKSPFEFVKSDRIVIMSDNMNPETLNLDKIKVYIIEIKDFLRKTSIKIKSTQF